MTHTWKNWELYLIHWHFLTTYIATQSLHSTKDVTLGLFWDSSMARVDQQHQTQHQATLQQKGSRRPLIFQPGRCVVSLIFDLVGQMLQQMEIFFFSPTQDSNEELKKLTSLHTLPEKVLHKKKSERKRIQCLAVGNILTHWCIMHLSLSII